MEHDKGPFRLEQDTNNTLQILNKEDIELCQFYCEADKVTEDVRANANFVLKAVNDAWKNEQKTK